MLKQLNNTKYAPFKLRDIIVRDDSVGCTNLINDDLYRTIGGDWFYYITQSATYKFRNVLRFDTNLITAYIYDNFKERVMLDKYSDEFYGWSESTDFTEYIALVKDSIDNTLIANAEKYSKLYYSMVAEFNPLWNVDGTEVTERELRQTGTVDSSKTGTETRDITGDDTTTRTGTETNSKSGYDSATKTGTETTTKTGTEGTANTGTETTGHTGTDTQQTSNTAYDSATEYEVNKVLDTKALTDTLTLDTDSTTTHNTTDTLTHNTTDRQDFNSADTLTHNTTDTLTHDTTDTLTHDTLDTNERDLTDTEHITITRQGNIGVTTTTKLLTEFREYADFNFINIVARDIVNTITFMTY